MSKLLRLAISIIEATSLPLLILVVLYILSGYQLLSHNNIHLIPMARAIHVDRFLRIIFVVLSYLHSLSGLVIFIERRIRRILIKMVLKSIAMVLLTLFITIALVIEYISAIF